MSKNLDWEKDSEVLPEEYDGNPYVPNISMGAGAADTMKKVVTQDIPDMGAAALQSATLEWADEAIEAVSPELASDYREFVDRARERNPGLTTLTELLTPDILDVATLGASKVFKIKKAIKALQGISGAVATDAVSQAGEGGEYSGSRSAMAGGIGAVAKGVSKLTPSPERLRASYTGVTPEAVSRKSGPVEAQAYAENLMEKLDKKGFFKNGKVDFDSGTLSWSRGGKLNMSKIKSKAKGSVVPPSQKELLARTEKAKESIAKETNELVEGWSGVPRDSDQMAMFPIKSETPGVFDVSDFNETIEDVLNDIPMDDPNQMAKLRQLLHFKVGNRAGEGGEISLVDLHDVRKELDSMIKYDRSAKTFTPQKEQALKGLASSIREKVKESVAGSGRMELLNEAYSDLADLSDTLTTKVLKPREMYPKAGLLSGNLGYKAVTLTEMLGDTISGTAGQIGKSIEKGPDLGIMERGIRKLTPVMSNSGEPVREPDSSRKPQGQFNAMPAAERFSMSMPKEIMKSKIPRTSEGLKEYSQLFKLKIAQEAENIVRERMVRAGVDMEMVDPMEIQRAATELYKNVDTVIEEHPDELPAMLPVWAKSFPSMFEKDRYNRIDGVVPNSMQPLVREEIRKNQNISNVQRINQLDLLNRSGEYKDNE